MSQREVCVSLGKVDLHSLEAAIAKYPFVEFRLDLLERTEKLYKLISLSKKSIITFHKAPPFVGLQERKESLLKAIEAGGFMLDLDVEEELLEVEHKSKNHYIKLIRSYHNFTETPSETELEKIIFHAKRDADFVKIATMVRSYEDALTLLNLLSIHKNIIVVGMGEKGALVRVMAPLLGSPWTYASLQDGAETAPGQINADILQKLLALFSDGDAA